jgi:hypothetical protein
VAVSAILAVFMRGLDDHRWLAGGGSAVERLADSGNVTAAAPEFISDIRAFRAEYETGQPFGSMWNEWVDALVAAAGGLRNSPRSASDYQKEKQRAESAAQRAVEEWLSKR